MILEKMYELFLKVSVKEIEDKIFDTSDRTELIFYTEILNTKLGLLQEKVIGEELF